MKVALTVNDFLRRAELVYPDRIAVVDEPEQPAESWGSIDYAEMARRARAMAAGLDELGIGVGERVAMVSHNSARLLTALFGVSGSGRVLVPINFRLVAAEVAHLGLTELEITPSMHARKARMAELSDGVIVLPGGFGTLDETFEMITWNQLGLVAVPVVFLDVAAYFAPLFEFIDASVSTGFVSQANAGLARRAVTVDGAVSMAVSAPDQYTPKWLG